jgi:PAS domain S-box-containing protein
MIKEKNQTENGDLERKLRDEAEEKLAQFFGAPCEMLEKNPEELLHELQVHKIELEMQNKELRKTQLALEESRQKYADLYDFAPVGYFTFTPEALIKEINLTGAALLGVARQKLIKARFRAFVALSDLDLWDQHFLSVLQQEEKQTCDLMLKRQDGSTFQADLESIRIEASRGVFENYTTVTDITERNHKQLEEVIRQSEERY